MTDPAATDPHRTGDPATASGLLTGGPVVVGVDGSSNARRALTVAGRLALAFDLDLAAFHALGLMTVIEGEHVPTEGHRDDIERLLRTEWCAPLAVMRGLRWRAELVYGSPTTVLMDMAEGLDADFVVVGSRGITDEQALGSTSHYVVHHCAHPVVVVPPLAR
jgi:nucleotide-binding universal stress UspA family protein